MLERLDRCFATDDWIDSYPESIVTHIPRTHSGHCLLLLTITSQQHNDHKRPFRFESMWCSHLEFPSIVHNIFHSTNDLLGDTNTFKANVTTWNRHVFKNIFHKKKHILARLNGIQRSNAYPFSSYLQDLESNIEIEFLAILKNEEDFWKLKSRIRWLYEGDANTRLFHTTTINRRRQNRILSLTYEAGNQIKDPKLIKETTRRYFANLFTTSHASSTYKSSCCEDICASLEQPFRYSEIKKAMDFSNPLRHLDLMGLTLSSTKSTKTFYLPKSTTSVRRYSKLQLCHLKLI